jgi:hypothetical protein
MPEIRRGRVALLTVMLVGCTVGDERVDVDSEADGDDGDQIDAVDDLLARAAPAGGDATGDRDLDGIADTTEEVLLRRYRPFFRFSQSDGNDESFRPANPVAEITNAQLKVMNADGGTSDALACGSGSEHHLEPADTLYTCRADTSLVANTTKTAYCLNFANTRYHGVSLADARANATGLYGHVAPTTINDHRAYKIEYWQFFAFNNQDITIFGLGSMGDHEGDWTSVQLWFDRELGRLVKVRYLIHGKQAEFRIPATNPTCRDCTITIKGPNFNPDPPNFFTDPTAYTDNAAEFYIDDRRFKHVVVYIERGGHETWPFAAGFAQVTSGPFTFKLNPHNGDGPSYLVPAVKDRLFNMGEVDHPLTHDGGLILQFNGHWGCTNTKELNVVGPRRRSPVGPALHCSWKWPDHGPIDNCDH